LKTTASSTAGIVAAIFDVLALTARGPSHGVLLFLGVIQNGSTARLPKYEEANDGLLLALVLDEEAF
jgi:hypothetical protein